MSEMPYNVDHYILEKLRRKKKGREEGKKEEKKILAQLVGLGTRI